MLPINPNPRPAAKWVLVALSALILVSCSKQHFFPVAIEAVEISPVYQLEVQNTTSQVLTFLPIRKYRADYAPKAVGIGQHIDLLIQVSKIKVGETFTREVVAGPYIDSGRLGPDQADVQYRDGQEIKRELIIDLESDEWFKAYTVSGFGREARPKTIRIVLTDDNLSATRWFRKGPDHP